MIRVNMVTPTGLAIAQRWLFLNVVTAEYLWAANICARFAYTVFNYAYFTKASF